MNRNTYVENQESSYISQIIQAQNRIRSKLPFYSTYNPQEHFNYLSCSRQSIQRQKLIELIPFKNQYSEFGPIQHLSGVIRNLNFNYFTPTNQNKPIWQTRIESGLSFRGYMKLILVERMINNEISEVNKTLVSKFSIFNKNTISTKNQVYVKVGLDIGVLIFLQCLKLSIMQTRPEQNNSQIPLLNNNNNITRINSNQGQYQYHQPKDKNDLPINNNFDFYRRERDVVSCECTLAGDNPQADLMIPFKRKQIFDKKQLLGSKNQQIFSHSLGKSRSKRWIFQTKTKDTEFKKEEEISNGVLENFSSEKNLWKNFSELNYEGKSEISKRNTWGSAFIQEDFIISTPRVSLNTGRHQNIIYERLANKRKR